MNILLTALQLPDAAANLCGFWGQVARYVMQTGRHGVIRSLRNYYAGLVIWSSGKRNVSPVFSHVNRARSTYSA